MKLLYAPTSPFVRKVMVVAAEAGLAGMIEAVPTGASPLERDPALVEVNPLGKIPALILDDGTVLLDSRVICEYLAARAGARHIFPADGAARWRALTQQALADGLLDAAISARYETVMRPQERCWSGWRDAQLAKIRGALGSIEAMIPDLDPAAGIGAISFACALGYLDFRFAELDWRRAMPAASEWYAAFATRPSMAASRPDGKG